MTWVKIDDGFEEHEKVAGLSDAAHRLWFRCACWCSQRANLVTSGFVPIRKVLEYCGGSKSRMRRLARELVEATGEPHFGHERGLWEPKDGGWQFHDWADYRPPEDLSEKRSAAGKAGAEKRWGHRQKDGKPDSNCHSKPDGKNKASGMASGWQADPGSRIPSDLPEEEDPKTDQVARASGGSDFSTSKIRDPMLDHLRGKHPTQRSDVAKVRDEFLAQLGKPKLSWFVGDPRADVVARAIDSRGLAGCLAVARHAKHDAMVSGKADERGQRHDTLDYVFGNANAFDRILTAAQERQGTKSRRKSATQAVREAKAR